MVICNDCKQEMETADKCRFPNKLRDKKGKLWARDKTYYDVNKRCHDCGIVNKPGNLHHLGCDIERCPKCGGQLIGCGCFRL